MPRSFEPKRIDGPVQIYPDTGIWAPEGAMLSDEELKRFTDECERIWRENAKPLDSP